MNDEPAPPVLLFDGDCNLCRASVRWIWKRDAGRRLTFAPLQSETGRRLLAERGLPDGYLESAVLVERDGTWVQSDAILRSLRYARGAWGALRALRILPRFLRDPAYRWIARNRSLVSRLLGTRGERWDPPAEERDRFPEWEAGRRCA